MSKTRFPRKDVLQSIYELTAGITPNRFVTTRPNAVGEQMKNFLIIGLTGMNDVADTYQLTRGRISVFVRDVQGGLENTVRLEEMQDEVIALFPISTPLFIATSPTLLPGGTDGTGFHSLIIQFNIRIHKDFDIHSQD